MSSSLPPSNIAAQEKLVALSRDFKKQQSELGALIEARQRLEMQATENDGVETQLKALNEGDKVYKRMGPALMPIEADEARDNVSKRLGLIRGEMERTETKIAAAEKSLASQKHTIATVQQEVIAALNDQGSVLSGQ